MDDTIYEKQLGTLAGDTDTIAAIMRRRRLTDSARGETLKIEDDLLLRGFTTQRMGKVRAVSEGGGQMKRTSLLRLKFAPRCA